MKGSLEKCRENLKNQIGKSANFNLFLKKIKNFSKPPLKKKEKDKNREKRE